jgi:nucleotide-binding universal stress UspA family protein
VVQNQHESMAEGRVRESVGDVTGCVVVGVDGSACGRAALRFAAHEARSRRCPLVVVRAWSLTTAPRPRDGEPGVVPPLSAFEAAVAAAVADEVAAELGATPGCEVRVTPVHDSPADALVAASRSAALVVVGSRGHGAVASLLLGSVSEHLVHHAEGPVAVVR